MSIQTEERVLGLKLEPTDDLELELTNGGNLMVCGPATGAMILMRPC